MTGRQAPQTSPAEAFFQFSVDATSHRDRKASLERIKAACDFFQKSGTRITAPAVAAYCDEHHGGPKLQSIHNSPDVLKKYLELRAAEQKIPRAPKHARKIPHSKDESVTAYMLVITEENRQLQEALTRINDGLRRIPGIPAAAILQDALGASTREDGGERASDAFAAPSAPALSPDGAAALSKLFDSKTLQVFNLEIYMGRLRNLATYEVLLEKNELAALRNLLAPNERDGA